MERVKKIVIFFLICMLFKSFLGFSMFFPPKEKGIEQHKSANGFFSKNVQSLMKKITKIFQK